MVPLFIPSENSKVVKAKGHVCVHNHAGAPADFVLPFPEPGTAGDLLPKV